MPLGLNCMYLDVVFLFFAAFGGRHVLQFLSEFPHELNPFSFDLPFFADFSSENPIEFPDFQNGGFELRVFDVRQIVDGGG